MPSLRPQQFIGVAIRSTARRSALRPVQFRPLSASTARYADKKLSTDDSVKTDMMPDDDHATFQKQKDGNTQDVQSSNVKAGMDAKANNSGGHATEEADSAGGKERAKKEFPEAPDPAIGMQDERGGRGGR